jgi:hypothetical protein
MSAGRFRNLAIAWTLSALFALISVTAVLADGGGTTFPH